MFWDFRLVLQEILRLICRSKHFYKAGLKSIQIHGTMWMILEPLLGDMPLVGALSIIFLRNPLLEIHWTGLTNLLDIPGLKDFLITIILDIMSN